MTTQDLIDNIDGLIHLQREDTTSTGHVGICLHAMAIIKDFETYNESTSADKLFSHPFYAYFQQSSNDIHSQYPLRKMAVIDALEGYKRYLLNLERGNRATSH